MVISGRSVLLCCVPSATLPEARAHGAHEHYKQHVHDHPVVSTSLALSLVADGESVKPVPEEQDRQYGGRVERGVSAAYLPEMEIRAKSKY